MIDPLPKYYSWNSPVEDHKNVYLLYQQNGSALFTEKYEHKELVWHNASQQRLQNILYKGGGPSMYLLWFIDTSLKVRNPQYRQPQHIGDAI